MGDPARSHSQSAAQRDPPRADHRLPGAIAKDAGRDGRELSQADGHDARGRCGTPTRWSVAIAATPAHRRPTAPRRSSQRAQRPAAADAATRRAGRRIRRARACWAATRTSPDKVLSLFEPHTDDDSQGQDLEAERVRQSGHHSRIGTADHHGLRGARGTTRGCDVVDAGLGSAPGDLRPRPGSRGRRSRLQLRDQRTGGDRPRRAPRGACRGAGRSRRRDAPTNAKRWFRRGQRWRVGCEGRISVLKRRHGLRRCRYHGVDGMHRWVGLGVIADNLINMATVLEARAAA